MKPPSQQSFTAETAALQKFCVILIVITSKAKQFENLALMKPPRRAYASQRQALRAGYANAMTDGK